MLRDRGLIFISLFATIASSYGLKLPATFDRCKVSPELDNKPNECLKQAIQKAIHLVSPGIKEIGILPFDPLKILEMKIEQGESSPVAIKLKFEDCDLIGTNTIEITEVNGKVSSLDGFHLQLFFTIPKITITGPYTISGKVLILPIEGVGKSKISLSGAKYQLDVYGEKQVKNGDEYLKVTNSKLIINYPEGMHIHFANLFKGDKALGDNTNRFLNENWKDIFVELRPPIEEAFKDVFEAYSKRILERIAFKNIFITE